MIPKVSLNNKYRKQDWLDGIPRPPKNEQNALPKQLMEGMQVTESNEKWFLNLKVDAHFFLSRGRWSAEK